MTLLTSKDQQKGQQQARQKPGASRKLLVLINPFSGSGKAPGKFKKKVQPVFEESDLTYQVVITSQKNGAQELIKDLGNLYDWDGIIVVSGDGLLFEVFNGLMLRDDWQKAIQIPVGIIPGGSGNGLAATLDYKTRLNGTPDPIISGTLNVTLGSPCPMDLVEVTFPTRTYYSFLSIGWGLICDIDIESEGLRFIGGSRFVLWSIYRSLVPKTYRGRLSYLPLDEKKMNGTKNQKTRDLVNNIPFEQDDDDADDSDGGGESSSSIGEEDYIPPLGKDVPSNWVQIEEDFIMIQTASQSHLSSTVHFAPESKLADGVIWLAYITSKVSVKNLLRFLSSLEDAKHFNLPYVTIVPVRAFRLEPLASGGIISIDGEAFEAEPIQAQILPSMGRIFMKNADPQAKSTSSTIEQ